MNERQITSRVSRSLVFVNAALLVGGTLFQVPKLEAAQRRGSVRHSSRTVRPGGNTVTSTTRTATRGTVGRPATAPATRAAARTGYRRGAAVGYRHGSYHGWYDARNNYWRWRTVTGLFRLGVYAATKPKQTTTVVVTGATYYYSGGVYYKASGSGYVVVAPPPGAVVYSVPTYSTVVYAGTTEYVYVNGAYYVPTTKPAEQPPPPDPNAKTAASPEEAESPSQIPMKEGGEEQNYEVVAAPVGATVPYLPEEAEEKTVSGKKYFVYDGTYYRAFASDGDTVYMVVEDPSGQA